MASDVAPTSRASVWLALVALTLGAFAARVLGLAFELPHTPNVDEHVLHSQLLHERGEPTPPHKWHLLYAYPRLFARTAAHVLPRAPTTEPMTIEQHRTRAAHDVHALRWMIAVIASLGVPLTFVLARRFVRDRAALVAAGLVGASILHTLYSVQARPHSAVTTLTLGAVVSALWVRRRGDAPAYLVAGVANALAVAGLQSGFFVLPALAVAHFTRERKGSKSAHAWFGVALAIVVVAAAYFYERAPPSDASQELEQGILSKQHGVSFGAFRGRGFATIASTFANYEPLLLALFVAASATWFLSQKRTQVTDAARSAAAIATRSDRNDLWVVLAHAGCHTLAFGLFDWTYQRFLVPLVPYLACGAAWLVERASTSLGARTHAGRTRVRTTRAFALLAGTVLAVQAFACARFTRARVRADTQALATRWVEDHLDRESARIAIVTTLELALARVDPMPRQPQIEDRFAFPLWSYYQRTLGRDVRDALAWEIFEVPLLRKADRDLLDSDPDAFVASIAATHVVLERIYDERRPTLRALREAVRMHARLVARFAPRANVEGDTPIQYDRDGPLALESWFALRATAFDQLGPEIEIWELARAR